MQTTERQPETAPNEGVHVQKVAQARPYVDASAAARLLGVDRRTVVADVQAGMAGSLGALSGEALGSGICVVEAWDLTEERLAMHRARLAP